MNTKGYDFEREVAAIFRTLGAMVDHSVAIAGNQIDIVAIEQTPSGTTVRIAIECKNYSRPAGVDVVNSFGAIVYLLRQRSLIDRATIVAANGFTTQAREAARNHDIEALDISDLRQRVRGQEDAVRKAEPQIDIERLRITQDPNRRKRLFVLMPFSKQFNDVYILGIRDVAERLGIVVERADDIEHNEGIVEVILDRIASGSNPNVFYEVGYSHALSKPTILITRTGDRIPFDLQNVNHIFYETIVELREKLERRLKSVL
jgi:Restriction endonuclease